MAGSTGAGIVALRSNGCIVIGPVGRGARFFIAVKRTFAELVSRSWKSAAAALLMCAVKTLSKRFHHFR